MAALAQEPLRPLAQAMAALRDGNWAAARIAARGDGRVAQDVILWHYLRAGQGDAAQVQDFLARNPDWPGLPYLREKSEAAMEEADDAAVRAFFGESHPETGSGALRLARALSAAGEDGAAQAAVVIAWRTLALSSSEQAALLKAHRKDLRPHHNARLDMALWNGWRRNARAMLPLVDEGRRKLAEARLALQDAAAGVDAKIEAVPEALRAHPGLAYDRFAWRARKGRTADAVELLLERSTSAEALGEPWAWASRRRSLARGAMRAGDPQKAYAIASTHFLEDGSDFADLEWLSGYLALRFLDRPEQAITHFKRFRGAVFTPISLGRAGYWLGRAHMAAGAAEAAQAAFAEGAKYQTSFYGLLAAEAGKLPPNRALSAATEVSDWRGAPFTGTSVFEAAVLLLAAGELDLAERFFTHLTESLDADQVAQLGLMLAELDQPHIQVMVGKRAAQAGLEVAAPYYALHPLAKADHPVPTELVLAIARRESEFDPGVVSPVGARGLMQVMPRTAREVAGWLEIEYEQNRLLTDPVYNATLGAAYLAALARQFDGNVVMIAAGYNAGPSRPERWMESLGDPRLGQIDVVDWIEFIPFRETRNYVMRVAESLPVYRARLGQPPHPVPFSQELTGSTLLARAPEGE